MYVCAAFTFFTRVPRAGFPPCQAWKLVQSVRYHRIVLLILFMLEFVVAVLVKFVELLALYLTVGMKS